MKTKTGGIVSMIAAYVIWGLLPIYWKLLQAVPPDRIIAHRVIWSFVFLLILLAASRQLGQLKAAFSHPRYLRVLSLAAVIVTANWLTYIYSVSSGQIVAGSLGYYINPLVSIALGALVFKERFSKVQILAIILAVAGVTVMTVSAGRLPWISLFLAFSFGLYGLIKKMVLLDSTVGLALETAIVSPLALAYLLLAPATGLITPRPDPSIWYPQPGSVLLLILIPLAGAATALPLILFATGARQLDLSMVGFLQYIAPTLMLLLGVFAYGEAFTIAHAICFGLIWSGLFLYTASRLDLLRRLRKKPLPADVTISAADSDTTLRQSGKSGK